MAVMAKGGKATRWILLIAFASLLAVAIRRPGGGLKRMPTPEFSEGAIGRAVDFDLLGGFELELPEIVEDERGLFVHANTPFFGKVPKEVREMDGRLVTVAGFMQPITLNKGRVAEFFLLRDRDSCCFGGTPRVNHWISVRMTNGAVAAGLGRPVAVTGRLSVREMRSEGVVVGIYSMEAGKVDEWKTGAKSSTQETPMSDIPTVTPRE